MRKRKRPPKKRRLTVESLEKRQLLSATPYGALPEDTGEYLLGRVAVTPVFLESDGSLDESLYDWTPAQVNETLGKIDEALDWWVDTLDSLNSVHSLEFVVDRTFAADPFETPYEGIARKSDDYVDYVTDFLNAQGHDRGTLTSRSLAFNHAQRIKHQADWSFSIFVVNSLGDEDGAFAAEGSFSRAFAFAGGLFYVVPSERPASTYAHELGHIFYARDEYTGAGNWNDRRGYYNTQNLNAANNPTPGFEQQPSIMSSGVLLADAYRDHVSPATTLAMVGWQDSDGDGIFDVLDNPILLKGSGRYDAGDGFFRFDGMAAVTTLLNQNSVGLQSDITLSTISSIEYQIDGGNWITISQPDTAVATLDIELALAAPFAQLRLRAVDASTGIRSEPLVFTGTQPATVMANGAAGAVRWEREGNGTWDGADVVGEAFDIQILARDGSSLALGGAIEPDTMPEGDRQGKPVEGVLLEAIGARASGGIAALPTELATSTGSHSFWAHDAFSPGWSEEWGDSDYLQLKATPPEPTTVATIDVIGTGSRSYGRLSAYSADGILLDRMTSEVLAAGEVQTLTVSASSATPIAYVVAGGHGRTKVVLDHFTYGSSDQIQTDAFGTFRLPHLPAGDYRAVVTPWSDAFTAIGATEVDFAVVDGVASELQFAFTADRSPWQNGVDPFDVSGDSAITPVDALQVINEINRSGPRLLAAADAGSQFYDVDGDLRIGPIDALQVINALNRRSAVGESEAARSLLAATVIPAPIESGQIARKSASESESSGDFLPAPADKHGESQILLAEGEFASDLRRLTEIPEQTPEKSQDSTESDSRIAAIDYFFSEPFHV